MKQLYLFISFSSIVLMTYACKQTNPIDPQPPVDPPVTEFFTETMRDVNFISGFALTTILPSDLAKYGYLDTLYFKSKTDAPDWRVAQWYSKYNLKDAILQNETDGSKSFNNESKKFALYPDNSLLLELNASKEYDHPRLANEPWVHLLIEQQFKFAPAVSTAKRIMFSMELMLVKCENKMASGTYDSSIHTAQSPFFFVVKDKNSNSYIWFGISSFDYRDVKLSDTAATMWDVGTQTYISNIAPRTVWGDINFKDNAWHKTNIDVKPYIVNALAAVQKLGHFPNVKITDLVITGMNFGWEIPGTFDAAIRVKGISLKVVK